MIPSSIVHFLESLSSFDVSLNVDKVIEDPGEFFFSCVTSLPFLIELVEDHYSVKIENIKLGDIIDELDS